MRRERAQRLAWVASAEGGQGAAEIDLLAPLGADLQFNRGGKRGGCPLTVVIPGLEPQASVGGEYEAAGGEHRWAVVEHAGVGRVLPHRGQGVQGYSLCGR